MNYEELMGKAIACKTERMKMAEQSEEFQKSLINYVMSEKKPKWETLEQMVSAVAESMYWVGIHHQTELQIRDEIDKKLLEK